MIMRAPISSSMPSCALFASFASFTSFASFASFALLAFGASVACGIEPGVPAPIDCGVASPVFDARGDVVQGVSDVGCVRIERKTIALGDGVMCKACPYEATALIVQLPDVAFELRDDLAGDDRDDLGALTYDASHHNWADVVTAHGDGDAVPSSFSVRILYDVAANGWDLEVMRHDENDGDGDDGDGDGDGDDDEDDDDDDDDDVSIVLPVVGSR